MEIKEEKLTSTKNVTFIARHYEQDYFTSPRHYHLEYEIAYIEESEGKLFVGNNIVEFKAGDLFIFAPRLVHCFKNNKNSGSRGKSAKATIALFKKEFLGISFLERKEASLLNKLLANAEAGVYIPEPSSEVVSLIKELTFDKGLRSVLDLLSILDYLSMYPDYKLLKAKWVRKDYYRLRDDSIDKIFEYVEKNFFKEQIFKEAVELSGMSKSSFSRYFKKKTEITFTQYLNEVRITKAQKLLAETNEKINQICFSSGFNNLTYFNRLFKNINGFTPREFRRISCNIH